jgi:hypothetical protein
MVILDAAAALVGRCLSTTHVHISLPHHLEMGLGIRIHPLHFLILQIIQPSK